MRQLDLFTATVEVDGHPINLSGVPTAEDAVRSIAFCVPVRDATAADLRVACWLRVIAEYLPTQDDEAYLRGLIAREEPLIFLYGANPHVCFVRTHRSTEPTTAVPVRRAPTERLLREQGYDHHSWYTSPESIGSAPIRAKVFRLARRAARE